MFNIYLVYLVDKNKKCYRKVIFFLIYIYIYIYIYYTIFYFADKNVLVIGFI